MQGQRGGGGRVRRTKKRRITNFTTPKMKAYNWTRTNMFVLMNRRKEERCRNPTLAKCGGEAQHSQSWGLGVLQDSQMFKV